MSVSIDRIDLDLDLMSAASDSAAPARKQATNRELIERLRPIVREILRQELEALRSKHGR